VKKLALAALLLIGGSAAARDSNVRWMKFDEALSRASMTGQPICVFVSVNPNGSG
jgi:hypothetical protein